MIVNVLIFGEIIPDSIDCCSAFFGFEQLGAEIVITKKWFAYNKIELLKFDVCVGGIDYCRFVLNSIGVKDFFLPCYPEQLKCFLDRNIEVFTVKKVLELTDKFIKPLKPKKFEAFIINEKSKILLNEQDNDTKVYVCDLIKFESEWRVYVKNHTIQAICFYSGDSTRFPDVKTIKKMITTWYGPCCYALDVGIVKEKTLLVEVNDFYSIGNYGLESVNYAEMLLMRWEELKKIKLLNNPCKEIEIRERK